MFKARIGNYSIDEKYEQNNLYFHFIFFVILATLISCAKKESKSKVDSNPQLFNAVGFSGTI